MHFYLPVAEMSADILVFLAMTGAVGFLSGLFGFGGGLVGTAHADVSSIGAAVGGG